MQPGPRLDQQPPFAGVLQSWVATPPRVQRAERVQADREDYRPSDEALLLLAL
jgi:hypothetical protein